MKKAITIIGIVALFVIIVLVCVDVFSPQSLPALQQAAQNDRDLATDARMKSLTAQVMVMVLKYDQSDTTNTPFIKVEANVTALNALLAQFKKQNGIDVASSIFSSDSDDVVRLKIIGANDFYCDDTVQANPDVTSIPVSGDNFTSNTDCAGKSLVVTSSNPNGTSPISQTSGNPISSSYVSFMAPFIGVVSSIYPSDWVMTQDANNYKVSFLSSQKTASVVEQLIVLPVGQTVSLDTFLSQFKNEVDANSGKFQQIDSQVKTINGNSWLVFSGMLQLNNLSTYIRIAIYVTGKYDNRQYYQFELQSTDKDTLTADAPIQDTMIASTHFSN